MKNKSKVVGGKIVSGVEKKVKAEGYNKASADKITASTAKAKGKDPMRKESKEKIGHYGKLKKK